MNLLIYVSTLVPLLALDSLWLFSTSTFYKKHLGYIFADSFNLKVAGIFYLFYAFGLGVLIIAPAIKNSLPLSSVFIQGALLGLMAYGAYDLTNQATLKDWPYIVTIVDMVWGLVVTGTTSVLAVVIYKYFKS